MNMQMPIPQPDAKTTKPESSGYNKYLFQGFLALFILVVIFGGWSMIAKINGAIIAGGRIDVEGRPKTLQHLDGGIVSEILVKNGDLVNKGDVVLRLDPTATGANRTIVEKRLNEAQARVDRLKAERDHLPTIQWSKRIQDNRIRPDVAEIIDGQTKLFDARRKSVRGQIGQLRERIAQSNEQIRGLEDLVTSKRRQLDIVTKELDKFREYEARGAVSRNRILASEREKARFEGEIATHQSEIARIRSAISETQIQILQFKKETEASILSELREVESELSDLTEQLTTAADQLKRVDVVAPVTGKVHNLAVTTIGGVVAPGQELMQIVPRDDRLIIEARISPVDIDQIYKGQKAVISLSAFNRRTTPQVIGHLIEASPDSTVDQMTGAQYFTVWLEIEKEEMKKLGDLTLIPGMPAECFIQTEERTVWSYLTKPAHDSLRRAFREE